MRALRSIQRLAAVLAAIPLLFPSWSLPATAKEPLLTKPVTVAKVPEPQIADVTLLPGNILAGELRDEKNTPLADASITVVAGRQTIATGTTNSHGEFAIEVARGGTYLVTAPHASQLVRAWTASAAPPRSQTRIKLSQSPILVRAQNNGMPQGLDPTWGLLLVGGVIAAIAIPLAINANDDNDSADTTPTGCEPESPVSN